MIFTDYISAIMEGNEELASTAQQNLYNSGEEIISFLVSINLTGQKVNGIQ